ncbi:hypothetical protein, partial [Luteolibacter marinus]|uniref:hypothetical protein n=1 Tax=Luteolibacter marinus TaxID=2776705 RepID=UPI0018684136
MTPLPDLLPRLIPCVSLAIFLLAAPPARGEIQMIDHVSRGEADSEGAVGNLDLSVTGGEILLLAATYDAGQDGILDGTITATFGGTPLVPVQTLFRPDGEVGSAIFMLELPIPQTGTLAVQWGVDTIVPFNGNSKIAAFTLSGIDTENPFGSTATNSDLSTGVTLDNVEQGHWSIYAIGAQQGLGNPPLDINGTTAAEVTGFVDLKDAIEAGARTLVGGLVQQTTGSVTYTHLQAAREAAAIALEVNAAPAVTTLFEDDFDEGVSEGAWTEQLSHADASVDYAFDYSAIGIPAAPRSHKGSTIGMRFLANSDAGVFQGISTTPDGQSFTGDFRLSFDAWLNYVGPLGPGGSGSTQIATFGWGSDGSATDWIGRGSNGTVLFGTTLDGGSAADYRTYVGGTLVSDLSTYAAGSMNGSAAYYVSRFPAASAPAGQLTLYPGQTGSTDAGEIAFAWHRIEIVREGDTLTWTIDGQEIATADISAASLDGDNICLGFSDTNSSSSADPNDHLNTFIVDNVKVTTLSGELPAAENFDLNVRTSDKVDTNNRSDRGIFGGAVMAGDSNDVGFGNNVPIQVLSIDGFDNTTDTGRVRLEADLTAWNADNTMTDPQGVKFRFTVQADGESDAGSGHLNGTFFGRLGIDDVVQAAPNDYPTVEEGEGIRFSIKNLQVLEAPAGHTVRFKSFSNPTYWILKQTPVITRPAPDTLHFGWSDDNTGDAFIGTAGPTGFDLKFEIVEKESDATLQLLTGSLSYDTTDPVDIADFATFTPGTTGHAFVGYEVTTDTPGLFTAGPAVDASGRLTFTALAPGSGQIFIRAQDEGGFTGALVVSVTVRSPYEIWADDHGLTPGENDQFPDDPDLDGRSNLEEFAFDGDPLSAADEGKRRVSIYNYHGMKFLSLTVPVRTGAVFTGSPSPSAGVDGVTYTVYGTLDFDDFDEPVVQGSAEDDAGLPELSSGWEYRSFWLSAQVPTAPRGFLL